MIVEELSADDRATLEAMMRDGECWELKPQGLRTKSANASGLWPTPLASGDRRTKFAQGGTPLGFAVRYWPTPTVTGNYNRKGASKHSGDGLATAVRHLYPTPTASMLTLADLEQANFHSSKRPPYRLENQQGVKP